MADFPTINQPMLPPGFNPKVFDTVLTGAQTLASKITNLINSSPAPGSLNDKIKTFLTSTCPANLDPSLRCRIVARFDVIIEPVPPT